MAVAENNLVSFTPGTFYDEKAKCWRAFLIGESQGASFTKECSKEFKTQDEASAEGRRACWALAGKFAKNYMKERQRK